jgi:hypothetical protein
MRDPAHRLALTALATVVCCGVARPVYAQAPGYAEILTPRSGTAVSGVVTVEGTADHPAFVDYRLAFSYADNPTDTWFQLGQPVESRVRQGTLGVWDTSGLTPGAYQLRLTVDLEGSASLETIVGDLRVGLPAVVPPAEPSATPARTVPTATLPAIAAPPPQGPAPAARTPGDPVGFAAIIGGATAAAFLIFLAAFLPLRRRLSVWAGSMRMRRVLRREEQQRQARRRR